MTLIWIVLLAGWTLLALHFLVAHAPSKTVFVALAIACFVADLVMAVMMLPSA